MASRKLAVQTGEMRETGHLISAWALQLCRENDDPDCGEVRCPKLCLSLGLFSWLKSKVTYHVEMAAAYVRDGRFVRRIGAVYLAVILWSFRNPAY